MLNNKRTNLRLLLILVFCISSSCSKNNSDTTTSCSPRPAVASCGTNNQLFGALPVAAAEIQGWVPLGQMSPTPHLLPTDHQYLYIVHDGVPLVAPGNVTVTEATRSTYSVSGVTDYKIKFLACSEVQGLFVHVVSIDPSLLSQMGNFDQNCFSYISGANTISTCSTSATAISVNQGVTIGTAKNSAGGMTALDFTVWDSRTAAQVYSNTTRNTISACDGFDRYHIVPSSDYFTASLLPTIAGKLGSYDGITQRTVAPIGGRLNYDVANTAQGYWYSPVVAGTSPEDSHLSLAPDNVNPNQQVISAGISQPNGYLANPNIFTPTNSGTTNRNFSQVNANGQIYCYEFTPFSKVFLIQMLSSISIKVEYKTGFASCATAAPFVFGSNTFIYER